MIDVLVVDDDFRVAEINAKYVGKVPGFRVAARAHSAAQALACVQRGGIDLVLLDHYLPDGTGLDLVHRMREQGHGTDVIMITAAGDVDDGAERDAAGRSALPGQTVHLRRAAHPPGLLRRAAPHGRPGRRPRRRRAGPGGPDLRRAAHRPRAVLPGSAQRPLGADRPT